MLGTTSDTFTGKPALPCLLIRPPYARSQVESALESIENHERRWLEGQEYENDCVFEFENLKNGFAENT
jgi:hypothetical protein